MMPVTALMIDSLLGWVDKYTRRYEFLCDIWKPGSRYPAYLHLVDIAGLIKGASEGAGLGNAFLSHIQAVDGLFHIVRAFDSK